MTAIVPATKRIKPHIGTVCPLERRAKRVQPVA